MAEPTVRTLLSRMALVALGAATVTIAAGCVTRTVYVVDDRDEPTPVAAAPQAAPLPTEPPRGANLAGPEEFYEPLAPYGRWHSHPRYGYVFSPSVTVVGAGWRPYTRGHWEYTEWGWTWVSDLPFGWATMHYGRWFYDAGYGWVWAPGTEWAPAWVTWRTGGGYVGWAPMPPGAVYGASYSVYDTSWIFVSTTNFGAPVIYPVIITGSYYRNCLVVTRPYRTTYVVYGSRYYRGPDPDYVRREGGRVVHRPISDVDNDRPTTRPPRGVRVSSNGHGDHDGSVGSRTRDRDGDRGRDGHGARGDGRGRDGDGRGAGRGDDDRGQGRGRGDDGQLANPRGPDGRVAGDDGRGQGRPGTPPGLDREDPADRGAGRGRDDGLGRDRGDVPVRGDSQPPATSRDGLEVVTPTPLPGGDNGNGSGRGDGRGSGRGDGYDDQGGVPADKRVVRPDGDEVRPPSDNPYGRPRDPSDALGAQSSPMPAATPPRGGPADSRFGRRLPSRFGPPAAQPPARSPGVAPTPAPANGYGRPAPAPAPSNGYGRPAPAPSNGYGRPAPYPAQQQPSGVNPRRSQSPRYAPVPAQRPQAPAVQPSQQPRQQDKKRRQSRSSASNDDDGERKQKPKRRSRR